MITKFWGLKNLPVYSYESYLAGRYKFRLRRALFVLNFPIFCEEMIGTPVFSCGRHVAQLHMRNLATPTRWRSAQAAACLAANWDPSCFDVNIHGLHDLHDKQLQTFA